MGIDIGSPKLLARHIREYQTGDDEFGDIFKALHLFIERTIDNFFTRPVDVVPILSFEILPNKIRGSYQPKNGALLHHVITLNPWVLKSGIEAAETLAHELVHLYENYIGILDDDIENPHSLFFHSMMAQMGIKTEGNNGKHIGRVEFDEGLTWEDWLEANRDLGLTNIIFQ